MKKLVKISLVVLFIFTLLFSLLSCGKSKFEVNFVVDGETYFTAQAIENQPLEMPPEPTKDEHTFDGWFVDAEKWTVPFDKDYFVGKEYSTDIYVYAKWTYIHTHTAGEWITVTDATCADEGIKIQKCIYCNEKVAEEAIPTAPHTEVTVKGFPETETTDGLTDGSYCSVCNTIVKSQKLIPALIQGADLKSELFEKNGISLTLSLPNSTEEFSITENIKINHKATTSLAYDREGKNPIEGTVKLSEGDNKFYLTVENGIEVEVYEINIRRRPNYTVTFFAAEALEAAKITLEEGSLATPPNLSLNKLGYTFSGWDFDFSLPITEDTSVLAVWTPRSDTAYTVEHYLINKDGSFSLYESIPLTGTTDTTVTAEPLAIEDYAYRADLSVASGTVAPDGSLSLKLYYEKVVFTVTFDTLCDAKIENTKIATGSTIPMPGEITNGNCVFMGWYFGDVKWDFATNTVTDDITLSAKWGFTVTFIVDGNRTEIVVEKGKTVLEPDAPEKDKSKFIGWYTPDSSSAWSFNTPITEDVTLEARWIPALPIAPI